MQKILLVFVFIGLFLHSAICQTVAAITEWVAHKENSSAILSSQLNSTKGKFTVYPIGQQATTQKEITNTVNRIQLKDNPNGINTKLQATQAASIHAVIMHLEYEAGMGGAIYPAYNAYILFKDGTIYQAPVTSPADMDIASSKQTEPKKWGSWKMDADKLIVYWPLEKPTYQNSTWKKSSYKNVLPAKKGEILEGNFKTLTGGGNTALGGDVLVVAAANITFNKEGKFTLAKTAGVSSGRDIWENTHSKTNEAGTYTLDGYTIELRYNNGKTQRQFFYFYPDSRKHFGIAKSVYLPKAT